MIFMLLLLFSTSDIKETASMVKFVEFFNIPERVAIERNLLDDEVMLMHLTLQIERCP